MRTYSDGPITHGFSIYARPTISAKHIDGPLLIFRDGQMHWLTIWERIQFVFGWTNAEKLERKHRPNLLRMIGTP